MRASTIWLTVVVGVTLLAAVHAEAWWESAVIYQIYPRSFKDSDGDGVGDLNGIASKMEYFKELGVDAIWLSPIYESPMYDFGYDITDYKAVAKIFGTMADFDNLIARGKSLGIRVVLDYVPNHTSHESVWFKQSVNKNGSYADYYIWADGKKDADSNTVPPSNWLSVFRKSAWEWNEQRQQYYLHQFVIQQPDLNYRSGAVRQEMREVLRFWLDRGVSGFRVDAVNFLYEAEPVNGVYKDEPPSNASGYGPEDYEYLNHIYTKDQSETYDVVYDWRDVLDEYTEKTGESKVMMTEGYTDIDHMMQYYGTDSRNGSMPFNFIYLGELTSTSTAPQIKAVIDKWMTNMPAGKTANWVNGNHDNSRMATRYGVDRIDTMNMLALLLPGLSITYQGEELGMTDDVITWADTVDPAACNTDNPITYYTRSRDPERSPFHWDNTMFAGFTTGNSTWLPVASNYKTVNVKVEKATNKSHINFYKDVVALKRNVAAKSGDLTTEAPSDTVMVIIRTLSENTVVGVINLSGTSQEVNLSSLTKVPQTMQVAASGVTCSLNNGVEVEKNKITMPAYCALGLKSITNSASKLATTSFVVYCVLYVLYAAVKIII